MIISWPVKYLRWGPSLYKSLWSWHFEVPGRYFMTLDTQQSKRHNHNANNVLRIVIRNSESTHMHFWSQTMFMSELVFEEFIFVYKLWISKVTRNMFWSLSSVMKELSRTHKISILHLTFVFDSCKTKQIYLHVSLCCDWVVKPQSPTWPNNFSDYSR